MSRVGEDLRLFHAAGFPLAVFQYPGEHDLWAEAKALNRALAGLGPFLAGAQPLAATVSVEGRNIDQALTECMRQML